MSYRTDLIFTAEVACGEPGCDEVVQDSSYRRMSIRQTLTRLRFNGWSIRGSTIKGFQARCPVHRGNHRRIEP